MCTLWGQNKGEISRKTVLFKNFGAAVLCKSVCMLLYKKKGMSVNLCEGKKRLKAREKKSPKRYCRRMSQYGDVKGGD